MRPVSLKFTTALEHEYFLHLSAQYLRSMTLCNIFSIWGMFQFIFIFHRFGYANPAPYIFGAAVIVASTIGLFFGKYFFTPRLGEISLAAGSLFIQACWLAIAVNLPDPWLKSSYALFTLVALFNFLMLPVRFFMRVMTGIIMTTGMSLIFMEYGAHPTIVGGPGLLILYAFGIVITGTIGGRVIEIASRTDFLTRLELDQEKKKSETLLYNALPRNIAERLKRSKEEIADFLPDLSVMFVDISGFTAFVKSTSAAETVKLLNELFTAFDDQITFHRCEKIKTIGDAYLIVSGLEVNETSHQKSMISLLNALRKTLEAFNGRNQTVFQLRAGIHAGPVVAGVIGKTKYSFDIWGDTVNLASRLESSAGSSETLVSKSFAESIEGELTVQEYRQLNLKGFGPVEVAVINGSGIQAAA